jgi:hypothetical protein
METAKSMSPQQAFYLLKHFLNLEDEIYKEFEQHGINKSQILNQFEIIGSKFHSTFCQNPFQIINEIKKGILINEIHQSNGRTAFVYKYEMSIGTQQITSIENCSGMKIEEELRGLQRIKVVKMRSLPETNYCTLVLDLENQFITAFPGSYAPAFPSDWMTTKEFEEANSYWENHVFIKQ